MTGTVESGTVESGAAESSDRAETGPVESLRLLPDCYLVTDESGGRHLLRGMRSEALGTLADEEEDALRRLAAGPCRAGELGAGALLRRLRAAGWLVVTVAHDDRPLYRVEPLDAEPPAGRAPEGLPVTLSRLAVLRRDGADLVLESPLSWCLLRVHDHEVRTLLTGAEHTSLPPAVCRGLLDELWRGGFLAAATGEQEPDLRLAQWHTHELWFHRHSRAGTFQQGYGPTRWADGRFGKLPARHEPYSGPVIPLHRPEPDGDVTLTAALEGRRSRRAHDDEHPVTAAQLGELLHRAAGAREPVTGRGGTGQHRVYPSGGGVYELEIYLAVRLAEGIEPGLYHYDPFEHALEHVCGVTAPVWRMLGAARRISSAPRHPQVLLLVAARFGRVMWTYESMAYALILKHVGVLYQNLYLVASAMGLAACGLGAGDPDSFAAATGMDPLAESTVGEFLIGSPVDDEEPRVAPWG